MLPMGFAQKFQVVSPQSGRMLVAQHFNAGLKQKDS